ncbi:hypothetical protein TTHERM_00808000 (macronuclear) [Tetrahymena thermophila SB210]|uniref:Uncharacterized protein n=1 Tax=Tetrahymena thermophila (strain SB210) TaxID=312017 RepID=Q233S3_TETTS|nr:hypothetical protein TTHERM_00808000 [Tetrahymena thermophila SB210]EAR91756.2 hypothetical protein TTHERM_00808000 [Tetrahymena thermophila SB210]|eukprot:XP_001012001.2 hypothetical protein TTHERM_00808000 [Tetrahymena thermophila SB210]
MIVCLIQNISSLKFKLTNIVIDFVVGHTKVKTPDPIRTPKLSALRLGQYQGGGPLGKSQCRQPFFNQNSSNFNQKLHIQERIQKYIFCCRPYQGENTGSHSNSEVKRLKAGLVLRWGTAWEVPVSTAFFLFLNQKYKQIRQYYKNTMSIIFRILKYKFCCRPYQGENTGSHSNSEVKRLKAGLVLRWGTAWEVPVSTAFLFFLSKRIQKYKFCCRPYQGENTGSHSNSEVKRLKAGLVLRWGTAWEVPVSTAFLFFQQIIPS